MRLLSILDEGRSWVWRRAVETLDPEVKVGFGGVVLLVCLLCWSAAL